MRRAIFPLLALSFLLGACASEPGEFIDGNGDTAYGGDTLPTKKSSGHELGYTPKGQPGAKKLGGIAVTVTAPNGNPISGAVLQYRGPSTGTVSTDAKGVARASGLKPGTYTIDLLSCGKLVRILGAGGGADFTVVQGKTSTFPIGNIGWEPRYQPVQRASASPAPPWKAGKAFTVSVEVFDQCSGKRARTAADLRPWMFEPSGVIRFAKPPTMRSTADGLLRASFQCNDIGEGDIVLRDPRDGRRFVHVVGSIPGATAFGDVCA